MKVVFMGTPDFAAESLNELIKEKFDVCGVFTQPDKPVGRHRVITPPPVKKLALENNIEVFQPESMRNGEALEILKKISPDVLAVVAYGKILPEEILNLPKYGCINVHGSLLPKYRGAAPIQWSVINNEKYAGVTTMFMDKGLDTGDIILSEKTEILEGETSGELYERLAPMGAKLLVKTLNMLENGNVDRKKQSEAESTYAPMLNKDMALVDFLKSAKELAPLICGLNPWPIAYTIFNGKRLKLFRAKATEMNGNIGEVLDDKKLIIACSEGSLEISEVQLEGSKKQSAEEFMRGHRIVKGTKINL